MDWTLDLISHLQDAPYPATRDELIDFAIRSGAPSDVIVILNSLMADDEQNPYNSVQDIWPDYPKE